MQLFRPEPVTCTLTLTWPPVLREAQLLSISELNLPKRSSELFVRPGKAIHRHALPPCISTRTPLVCLLLASYCWADLCLSTWTVVCCEPLLVWADRPYWTRLSGLTRFITRLGNCNFLATQDIGGKMFQSYRRNLLLLPIFIVWFSISYFAVSRNLLTYFTNQPSLHLLQSMIYRIPLSRAHTKRFLQS